MKEVNNYRRKNYFIKKGFQGRYMFNFYLLLALLLLVFTVLISYNTAQYLSITYENYDLQVMSTSAMLFEHILLASWIILIPLGLLLTWVVMRHTHRIAGPLYKFEIVLEQMSRGILDTNLQLRKSDDGQEVVSELKEVNLFLTTKVCEMRVITEQLMVNPGVINSPEVQKMVLDLRESLAEFEIME